MIAKQFKLNSMTIPSVGIGTYQLRGMLCTQTINFALSIGYHLVDTSPLFSNEHMIGISLSRVDRSSVFLSTKVSFNSQGYKKSSESIERSLENLKVKYIDLCTIEWPGAKDINSFNVLNAKLRLDTWKSLQELKAKGVIKHVGVANYELNHLQELCEKSDEKPEAAFTEIHPLNFDASIFEFCQLHKIQLVAHAPLMRKSSTLWNNFDIMMLAKKYKVKFSQIILYWTLSKGIAVIPKSENFENIRSNINFDFEIEERDLLFLDSLNQGVRITKDTKFIR